jgi:transposase-like protein
VANAMPRLATDLSRLNQDVMSCPRCRAAMDEVVRIEPTLREKGLIAYECPRCVYVTSVLLEPQTRRGGTRG